MKQTHPRTQQHKKTLKKPVKTGDFTQNKKHNIFNKITGISYEITGQNAQL